MELIPTERKEKLPKGFSYPIGAEAISFALREIPHFKLMRIIFSWKDTYWASKYNARLKVAGTITVIEVVKYSSRDSLDIFVHAVPADHSQDAREKLLLSALKDLCICLEKPLSQSGFFRWQAHYDLTTKSLRFG